ncbi:MAG: HDIG domain-containing protein [Thermoplasmatota archaeon]
MVAVSVYRYGHRLGRDKRITTHTALVARAFGAREIVVDTKDEGLEETVADVNERFGNDFSIETGVSWRRFRRHRDGAVVHLTMYGEHIDDVIDDIRRHERVIALVGSQKVPGRFYGEADYNVAVGNQPHSEVAALALFLHYVTDGGWATRRFYGTHQVIPQPRGKKVVERDYESLLRDAGCQPEVVEHARKVQRLAVAIAERIRQRGGDVDLATVKIGAMLHDLGRSETHGIGHIPAGVRLARELGLPENVVRVIERHGGAGIDPDEAERLGLPPGDYVPQRLEEKIVAHADNLTGMEYRDVDTVVQKLRRDAGEVAADRAQRLHDELSERCGCDVEELL